MIFGDSVFQGLACFSTIPPFHCNILQSFGHVVLWCNGNDNVLILLTPISYDSVSSCKTGRDGTGTNGSGKNGTGRNDRARNGNGRDGGSQALYNEQIHALTQPSDYDCYRTSEFVSFASLLSSFSIQYLLFYSSILVCWQPVFPKCHLDEC